MFRENENVTINASDLRFAYFGRRVEKAINSKGNEYNKQVHDGVACVGYTVEEKNGKASVIMGFTFCNPVDNFDKTKARLVINKRINGGKNLVIDVEEALSYEQVINLARGVLTAVMPDESIEQLELTGEHPTVGGVKLPRWYNIELFK